MNNEQQKKKSLKSDRSTISWTVEFVKLIVFLLIANLGYTMYYEPKQNAMFSALADESASRIVVIDFAKLVTESKTKNQGELEDKVAFAIERLNEQGFIVLDSTSLLGQHKAYVLETKFIDSIQL